MKRLDGIYQNPHCYNLKDLTVGDLCEIKNFETWMVDGDRQVLRLTMIDFEKSMVKFNVKNQKRGIVLPARMDEKGVIVNN